MTDGWCKNVFSISPQLQYHHLLLSLKQSKGNRDTLTILIVCDSYFEEITEECGQQQGASDPEPSL